MPRIGVSAALKSPFAQISLLIVSSMVPIQAANILVVAGTDGLQQTAATQLNTDLAGTNTITVVNTGVPVSLAGFTQIYDTRYNNAPAFTVGEMNQYLTFLNAAPANTLFLMGENAGFAARNTAISQFITLAGGGTIAPPASNNAGAETVRIPFTGPNPITTITFAACGVVTSRGTGNFATTEAGFASGCSLFFDQGQLANALTGALVVVYDVNFAANAPNGGAVNEVPFRLNLERFAAAPLVGPPPTPAPSSVVLLAIGIAALIGWSMWRISRQRISQQ